MAVSFIGGAAANSGAASTLTVTATVPAAAQAGDLLLVEVTAERALQPTLAITDGGLTSLRDVASTNLSVAVAYKFLTAADLGDTVTGAVSTARRMALGVVVLRGAGTPSMASGALVGLFASTVPLPDVTPTVADSMLVGIVGYVATATPFIRTFTPGTGFTEWVESAGTATASTNGHVYFEGKLLTGGAGVAQTGLTATQSGTDGQAYPQTVVVPPAAVAAVTTGSATVTVTATAVATASPRATTTATIAVAITAAATGSAVLANSGNLTVASALQGTATTQAVATTTASLAATLTAAAAATAVGAATVTGPAAIHIGATGTATTQATFLGWYGNTRVLHISYGDLPVVGLSLGSATLFTA